MTATPHPLRVVLPLLGDPADLVAAVTALAAAWPDDVDAALLLPCRALRPRDLAVLAAVEGDVEVVASEQPSPVLGDLLALAAAAAPQERLLVLDPAALPDEAGLRALAAGQSGPGVLLAPGALAAAPVLTAAVDHRGLAALARATVTPAVARPVVTAALIVKDEQRALPACLASLQGHVDEVVVCDTGSSDRTVEVARAFGATVVTSPWTGSFAAARNVALDAARGTWVLSIDADEQLEVQPGADVRALVRQSPTPALALKIHNRESRGTGFEHDAARLFRRAGVRWRGDVHENVVDTATGRAPALARATWCRLLHDGYLQEVFADRGKAGRNLAIAEREHAEAVAQDAPHRWKTAFELARALGRRDEPDARLEPLLREALRLMPARLQHLRSEAAGRLVDVLVAAGRDEEALTWARAAVQASPANAEAQLALAARLAACGRLSEAVDALAPPTEEQLLRVMAQDLHKREVAVPRLRGLLLQQLGDAAAAADALSAVAAAHPATFGEWAALRTALRDAGRDWTAVLADCAASDPAPLLAALSGLPADDRDHLHAALRARGVDPEAHEPDAVRERAIRVAVAGHTDDDVARAAAALEDTDPDSALRLWQHLPSTSAVRVGRARCLLALDDVPGALDALDGIDPRELAPVDVLLVAAVAGAVGDAETASSLLSGLPPLHDPLQEEARALARSLGVGYPTG